MFEEDRAQFSSDNITAPLISAGTIELAVLAPSTGIDPIDGATALVATKRIVVNPAAVSSNDNPDGSGTGMGTGPGGGTPPGPGGPGGPTSPVRTYALVNL